MGLQYHNPFKGLPHEAYKRPTTRYDGDAPYSIGFSKNETWGALKRCWLAYRAAAFREHDINRATKYARRIRKLQFELGITILEFPNVGLYGTNPEDVDLMCE